MRNRTMTGRVIISVNAAQSWNLPPSKLGAEPAQTTALVYFLVSPIMANASAANPRSVGKLLLGNVTRKPAVNRARTDSSHATLQRRLMLAACHLPATNRGKFGIPCWNRTSLCGVADRRLNCSANGMENKNGRARSASRTALSERQGFHLAQPVIWESRPISGQGHDSADDGAVGVHVASNRCRRRNGFTVLAEEFRRSPYSEGHGVRACHTGPIAQNPSRGLGRFEVAKLKRMRYAPPRGPVRGSIMHFLEESHGRILRRIPANLPRHCRSRRNGDCPRHSFRVHVCDHRRGASFIDDAVQIVREPGADRRDAHGTSVAQGASPVECLP